MSVVVFRDLYIFPVRLHDVKGDLASENKCLNPHDAEWAIINKLYGISVHYGDATRIKGLFLVSAA